MYTYIYIYTQTQIFFLYLQPTLNSQLSSVPIQQKFILGFFFVLFLWLFLQQWEIWLPLIFSICIRLTTLFVIILCLMLPSTTIQISSLSQRVCACLSHYSPTPCRTPSSVSLRAQALTPCTGAAFISLISEVFLIWYHLWLLDWILERKKDGQKKGRFAFLWLSFTSGYRYCFICKGISFSINPA